MIWPWNKKNWPVDQIRKWIEIDGNTHEWVGQQLNTTGKQISKIVKREHIQSQRVGPRSGSGHPDWKGGRIIDRNGYVLLYCPDHPHKRKMGKRAGRYVLEHRLVMEKHLGRLLDRKEVVHHKNGVNDDNRIDNLELFSGNGLHLKHELTGKCPKWSEAGKEAILISTCKPRPNRRKIKQDDS